MAVAEAVGRGPFLYPNYAAFSSTDPAAPLVLGAMTGGKGNIIRSDAGSTAVLQSGLNTTSDQPMGTTNGPFALWKVDHDPYAFGAKISLYLWAKSTNTTVEISRSKIGASGPIGWPWTEPVLTARTAYWLEGSTDGTSDLVAMDLASRHRRVIASGRLNPMTVAFGRLVWLDSVNGKVTPHAVMVDTDAAADPPSVLTGDQGVVLISGDASGLAVVTTGDDASPYVLRYAASVADPGRTVYRYGSPGGFNPPIEVRDGVIVGDGTAGNYVINTRSNSMYLTPENAGPNVSPPGGIGFMVIDPKAKVNTNVIVPTADALPGPCPR